MNIIKENGGKIDCKDIKIQNGQQKIYIKNHIGHLLPSIVGSTLELENSVELAVW